MSHTPGPWCADGPDCDWCGASEEDMDVYTVSDGNEFLCQDCYDRLIEALTIARTGVAGSPEASGHSTECGQEIPRTGHRQLPDCGNVRCRHCQSRREGVMSHTPGPWWVCEPGTYGPDWEVEDSVGLTCKVYGDDAPAKANACLIAAAPELLAVCHQLLAWQSKDDPYAPDDWMELATELGAMAGRAIAKAEGRE